MFTTIGRRAPLPAAALVFALGLAASASADEAVTINNFAYAPATLTVAAGTRVTWANRDDEPHTVLSADGGATFKSPALDTGDSYSFTFDKPGSYKYFCSLHPHMTGTVVVK